MAIIMDFGSIDSGSTPDRAIFFMVVSMKIKVSIPKIYFKFVIPDWYKNSTKSCIGFHHKLSFNGCYHISKYKCRYYFNNRSKYRFNGGI